MRKGDSLLLNLFFVLLSFSFGVQVASGATAGLTISDMAVSPGQQGVILKVSLTDHPNIRGGDVRINYDSSAMTFVSGSISNGSWLVGKIADTGVGEITILLAGSPGAIPAATKTELAEITFNMADTLDADSYPVSFEASSFLSGDSSNPLELTTINGTITVGNSSPTGLINVSLQADDNVAAQIPFDVEVHMSGEETVGSFDLYVSFDNTSVSITDISPLISGVVVPDQGNIAMVNTTGSFSVGYASNSGFIPGFGTKVVAITCEALIEEGDAIFETDDATMVQDNTIPPTDITGVLGNKTVRIHPDFMLYPKGDANGDSLVTSTDALYILHFIAGNIASDMLMGNCDVSGDGIINAADALYVLHYVAGNIIEFP